MSTPPEHPHSAPTDVPSGSMVRVCDRCGTVCSADQEWCLNCGVRMTEASQRLPGLRAAGLVVALAVLLAGGAAAASYAALRGDARSAANVPSETTAGPVAAAPAPAPAVPPAPAAPIPATPPAVKGDKTAKTPAPATPPALADAGPSAPSGSGGGSSSAGGPGGAAGSGSSGGSGSTGGSGGSGGSGASGSSGSGSSDSSTRTRSDEPSGPVVFASGQGTIYDPRGIASDKGEEGNAIDGSTSTSWTVKLSPGKSGGLGYVLDFDDPTALRSLRVSTRTAGLEIKVLGTTKSALPKDELDSNWDTIASDRTLKSGSNSVPLKAVSGAKSKYRHVLVLFTSVPGSPATAVIREFGAVR